MRAHSHAATLLDRQMLGELLHSVSQPLTTLRCSLELSLDEETKQQQHAVAAALEQTEDVIGMIQLMRECLEAERDEEQKEAIELAPVLQGVLEDLWPVAIERNIRLRMIGTCSAKMAISHDRMRKALHYLLSTMIEQQSSSSNITLHVAGCTAGAVVWIEGEVDVTEVNGVLPSDGGQPREPNSMAANRISPVRRDSVRTTMRRARLAIAAHLLEGAGAALTFDAQASELVLRIPRLTGKST